MNKRKVTIVVSILSIFVGAVILMIFFASMRQEPQKVPQKEIKRYVKTRKVVYGNIESQVTGRGRLSSRQLVDAVSEVQGRILPGDVPLKKGQSFKKSDLLFRIYDREARLGLLAKKSSFLNAVANLLPDFKVDFPKSYPKWTAFLGTIDIEKDLPQLPGIESDKEKIFTAGRGILSDYYSIKSEEERLKKYAVYAPFNGTYTEVIMEVGSVANPGSRVGKIIQTDQLELEVPIEVHNADWIKKGDRVHVTMENGSKSWAGKVVRKGSYVEPTTQSISVFVALNGTNEHSLYPGLYLKAVFDGVIVENAMQMPRNAVFNANDVFIVKDGRLAKREITIHKIDEKTLIFSGLEQGTELVVEPLVNVAENTAVELYDHQDQTKSSSPDKPGKSVKGKK